MRQPRRLFLVLIALLVAQACGPGLNAVDQPSLAATATPDLTSLVPLQVNPDSTVQALDNVKPDMAVGGLYRYFDGALLDAVPNQGPFLMGDNLSPDAPQHQVTVSDFWIYSTEVTNQMYAWCVSVGKCTAPNAAGNPNYGLARFANYPVTGVNWDQAASYCSFAHGSLPTEAQWEKAASWDPNAKAKLAYPWGDKKKPSCNMLDLFGCPGGAVSVTSFGQGASPYGALNMSGNVSEWISDWYSAGYYSSSPVQDPQGPGTGIRRVIRGGSFQSDIYLTQPARRYSAVPATQQRDLGFRCVVQDPAYFAPFCTAPVFYGAVIPTNATSLPGPTKPCSDPVIQHFEGCGQNKTPINFVTILSSPPTNVTVSGLQSCSPSGNDVGKTHQCPLGVTITVQSSCGIQPVGSPACPPNYTQDPKNPDQCIAAGAPGACAAGYQFDSKLQCCTVAQGSNAPTPLCSVGEHLFNGTCVDDATGPQAPASLSYTTNSGLSCAPNPTHQCPAGQNYVCSNNGCACK